MTDPRTSIVDDRLKEIDRIIAVSSGKGGVGKSLVASTLALTLRQDEYKVGLFDLDFTSPSTHLILGAKDARPKEEKGIIPPTILGLEYMSIIYYSKDHAVPLRGADVSNALIELLSITRWGKLDFLVIDTPPGIGDVTLDLIRLVKKIEFLVVTTPSLLAFETVRKLADLLKELHIPIRGIVENMKNSNAGIIRELSNKTGLEFLSGIFYDSKIEEAIGHPVKLLKTDFAKSVKAVSKRIAQPI